MFSLQIGEKTLEAFLFVAKCTLHRPSHFSFPHTFLFPLIFLFYPFSFLPLGTLTFNKMETKYVFVFILIKRQIKDERY